MLWSSVPNHFIHFSSYTPFYYSDVLFLTLHNQAQFLHMFWLLFFPIQIFWFFTYWIVSPWSFNRPLWSVFCSFNRVEPKSTASSHESSSLTQDTPTFIILILWKHLFSHRVNRQTDIIQSCLSCLKAICCHRSEQMLEIWVDARRDRWTLAACSKGLPIPSSGKVLKFLSYNAIKRFL